MVLIKRRVDAAGAATKVTDVVPFNAPSFSPSVNAVPVSSDQALTKDGFVVAAAPDMATTIDLVVASKINMVFLYLEINQE